MLRLFISVIFCAVIAFFVSLRVPELTATVCGDAAGAMIAAMVCVGCASLFLAPAKTTWLGIRRFALITLVSNFSAISKVFAGVPFTIVVYRLSLT